MHFNYYIKENGKSFTLFRKIVSLKSGNLFPFFFGEISVNCHLQPLPAAGRCQETVSQLAVRPSTRSGRTVRSASGSESLWLGEDRPCRTMNGLVTPSLK